MTLLATGERTWIRAGFSLRIIISACPVCYVCLWDDPYLEKIRDLMKMYIDIRQITFNTLTDELSQDEDEGCYCDLVFTTREALDEHRNEVQSRTCEECGRIFVHSRVKDQHFNAVHQFSCQGNIPSVTLSIYNKISFST